MAGALRGAIRLTPQVEDRLLAGAFMHRPVADADQPAVGHPVPFYRDWLAHPLADQDYLAADGPAARSAGLAGGRPPGRWLGRNVFPDGLLQDYRVLGRRARNPYLTIGPWSHLDPERSLEALRQGLIWFDVHLKGDRQNLRPEPVQFYLLGADTWRTCAAWPPEAAQQPWYLHPEHGLSTELPTSPAAVSRYVYDPSHPTPAVGGPLLSVHSGPQDNRQLKRARCAHLYQPGSGSRAGRDRPGAGVAVRRFRPALDRFLCPVV